MSNEFYIVPKDSLDATADAIREKTGSQASIEFTQEGFADAIEDIEIGYTLEDIASANIPGDIVFSGTFLPPYLFYRDTQLTSFTGNNVTTVARGAAEVYTFEGCTALTTVNLPKVVSFDRADYIFKGCVNLVNLGLGFDIITNLATGFFQNCTSITGLVFPAVKNGNIWSWFVAGCTALVYLDIGSSSLNAPGSIYANAFNGATALNTLIIRYANKVWPLANVSAFTNTPFASGGTGGTIYIPKSLYDHLGDGTSSDYKAATNWSTIDGYGTITWAQIEGSYYETHYADDTEIPST